MRTPMIAGNWKMNHNLETGRAVATAVAQGAAELTAAKKVEVIIAPSFVSLSSLSSALKSSPDTVQLAAQNMHWAEKGAYTGDISPSMLLDVGCSHVILGHSERRHVFLESDELINRKVHSAIAHGLKPIVCIGETLDERESNWTEAKNIFQLRAALVGVSAQEMSQVVIAYEPVWAIGTGKTATPEQAQEVHALIRAELKALYNEQVAHATRILYGGSVKPDNIGELLAKNDIDGALVGGASLTADSFLALVAEAAK